MSPPSPDQFSSYGADSSNRVAAVFATMNRYSTAQKCIGCLARQSRHVDKLFVVDNASTDGTAAFLSQVEDHLNLPCEVLSLTVNVGNAGGIKAAMELAFRQGFDAVWILDDDSWPEPNALEALLDDGPDDGIRTSTVLAHDSNELSWPCEFMDLQGHWRFATGNLNIHSKPYQRVRRSWLGALITKAAYDVVGPVNADLFLRGEDEDYPRRLEKAGYTFWMMSKSILRHPSSGKLLTLSLGDYKISLEQDLTGDKLYYRIRNMLYIKREESGPTSALILALGYLLLVARWIRPLRPSLVVFLEAFADASAGRLGKRGAFGIKHLP